MENNFARTRQHEELRQRAEELLSRTPEEIRKILPHDIKKLIHELDVYQLELEMQNEELRTTQAELVDARNQYFDLYDLAPIGYLTLDEKFIIKQANFACVKLLGVEKKYLLHSLFSSFISPDFKSLFYEHIKKIFQTKTKQTCELKLKKRDGTEFYAQMEGIAAQGESENINALRLMLADITDRKRVEDALKKAYDEMESRVVERTAQLEIVNKELAASNKALNEFAYVVAHDLKAPLRTISQLSDIVVEDYQEKLNSLGKKYLQLIKTNARQMHYLIEGILEYSKLGGISPKKEIIDSNKLVKEIIKILVYPSNIKITINNTLPKINFNKTQLRQVFQNLLDNSIKFMDKENGEINISSLDKGEFWEFCVADNGPGIKEAYFSKIFEIFQMLERSADKKNTGIGLPIVKKIIELNGGKIWVESEPGQGSKFYFTIPSRRRQKK